MITWFVFVQCQHHLHLGGHQKIKNENKIKKEKKKNNIYAVSTPSPPWRTSSAVKIYRSSISGWSLAHFLVFLCFKCAFSFQKEPNPWYRRDPLAEGFAETEESVSDPFLRSKVHVCTLIGGVSLPDMLYPILSWWHLARNRQSLTLQGDSHHNKSRWLEENPCAESVGPELYRQENKH